MGRVHVMLKFEPETENMTAHALSSRDLIKAPNALVATQAQHRWAA